MSNATPHARAIHDAVMKAVNACGPVEIAPTKTGINLLSGSSLGSIKFGRNHVDVGLVFTKPVNHKRLELLFKLSAQSYAYRVRVTSPDEVDANLKAWIRTAYETGLLAGRRPGSSV